MSIFKRGKRHDEQEEAKWKDQSAIMARANAELHDKATALSLRLRVPYAEAAQIIRAEDPKLRANLQGKGSKDEASSSRSYTKKDEDAALVRKTVDRAIQKALSGGLITHYKYGPAYLESADPWLWKRYMSL